LSGIAGIFRLGLSYFRPEERGLTGVVLNLPIEADTGRMSAGSAGVDRNRTVAVADGLQQCGSFARVERIDARIAGAGKEQNRGVIGAGLQFPAGRVTQQTRELTLFAGGAVSGDSLWVNTPRSDSCGPAGQ